MRKFLSFLLFLFLIPMLVSSAYIKPKHVKWDANLDPNWSGVRIQIADPSVALNCIVPIDPHVDVAAPALEYELPGIFDLSVEKDYKILACALDSMGHISDGTELVLFLDMVPPPAMSNVRVE